MINSALFAFLHFVAVFGIVGTLVVEWLVLSPKPTLEDVRRLQFVDRWYGIFAGTVLVVGALRVVYFEKGGAFYTGNPFFHLKLALFVAIGLLSIYPTIRFIAWGKQARQGIVPAVSDTEFSKLRLLLRLEIIALAGAALCASLMARGIGF